MTRRKTGQPMLPGFGVSEEVIKVLQEDHPDIQWMPVLRFLMSNEPLSVLKTSSPEVFKRFPMIWWYRLLAPESEWEALCVPGMHCDLLTLPDTTW